MTPTAPTDVGVVEVAELTEPEPWRSPVPFLWLAIVMLVTGAGWALATGAADAPDEEDARARIVAAAGAADEGDFAFSMVLEFEGRGDNRVASTTTMEGGYDADSRRLHATAKGSPEFEMEIIVDGKVQYLRFASGSVFADATGGKPWGRVERAEPLEPAEPSPFTANPLERLAELGELTSPIVRVGEERVRGVDTVHFRTTIDQPAVGASTGTGTGGEATRAVEVDVWLDEEDRFRRLRQSFHVDGTRFTSTFEVFDLGTPVSIDLPPEDQVGPFDTKDLFPPRPAPAGD